ncbi:hypothetical protein MAR_021146 [Mya arenaria]|uniref:DDE Tnp4 domain-containing protein n=1 Tax=Mya arenaria TaxID=6604 RepID=A0ABY7EA15_MYAAR|nr:hypothetical protein MAR_021146 [Mya arenaria]
MATNICAAEKKMLIGSAWQFLEFQSRAVDIFAEQIDSDNNIFIISAAQLRENGTRSINFFEETIPRYSFDEFRQHFRLTRPSFEIILTHFGSMEGQGPTNKGRKQIPLEKELLVTSAPIYEEINKNKEKYIPENSYIIGDQSYPLLNWLMKKFPETGTLSTEKCLFNKCLSVKRKLIEQTFGILKGRFRKLKFMDISKTIDIPEMVIAASTLHNICSDTEEDLDFFWKWMLMI